MQSTRLKSLDGVRGLLMCFMALDHASFFLASTPQIGEMWDGPFPTFPGGIAFLTRFISCFCAPGFFFLMGTSMVLLREARKSEGWSEGRITKFFLTRGLVFISLQFLIENPLWALSYRSNLAENVGYFGVLFSLGSCMIICAFFLRFTSRTLLFISILGIYLSEFLVPASTLDFAPYPFWTRLLLIAGQNGALGAYYPIFPWAFVTLLGILFGQMLISKNDEKAFRTITIAGTAALALFALIRFATPLGNLRYLPSHPDWINYLTLIKYPPSTLFLLFTLGFCSLFLAAWENKRSENFVSKAFETLGQAPFFFYLAHITLFGLLGLVIPKGGVGMGPLYLFWISGVLFLIPCTKWFAHFKKSQAPTSLWRLF